jgi:hypothetical protein
MDEGVLQRPVDHLAEFRPRHEQGVDVDAIGVEGQVGRLYVFVVDGHEQQIDIGLLPDNVVGEAAAEQDRQDRAIPTDVIDQSVECRREALADRLLIGGHEVIVDRTEALWLQ